MLESFSRFIKLISKYPNLFHTKYNEVGNSSFCLPFICKSDKTKKMLEKYLSERGVETRPLCSGNLLRQPFLTRVSDMPKAWEFPLVEFLHEHGFFIGNNHLITEQDWQKLEKIIET